MTGSWLHDAWERRGVRGKLGWLFLLPLAWLYRGGVALRNGLFALGWSKARALARPVVSVGNLSVGGTGKTQSCIWLAQALQKRGLRVAILSRGYKRKRDGIVIVTPQRDGTIFADGAAEIPAAGDEPFMMARLYGQTVAVGANRYDAAQQLLSTEEIDVFVLDDGFQHRRLKRDVDVVLLGDEASTSLLPAGPFREPLRSARRAHFVLATGAEKNGNALSGSFDVSRVFFGSLRAVALGAVESNRWVEHPLSLLFRSTILAVAGIGKAENFYRTLHEAGGEIADTIEYADHHDYSARDWQEINRAGRNVDLIVTTEKDLVKLARYPFPKDKLMALRVAMQIDDGETLLTQILERLPVNR